METIIDQLKKMIDGTEFSDRVKDKVKMLSVKAALRQESDVREGECLTPEEKKELISLIKADMILDGMRAKICQAYLSEVDKILNEAIK